MKKKPKIAILIPCFNEEKTVGKVVSDFKIQLPDSIVYVFDNNSTDRTVEEAIKANAIVISEPQQGKGFVFRSMLEKINADVYVLVDGDDTYPANVVHSLMKPIVDGTANMTIGNRMTEYKDSAFRPLHVAGNLLVKGLINKIFRAKLNDILSGYRVFDKKVVRYLPVVSAGFEIETEMTIHLLNYKLKLIEVEIPYGVRPKGSKSKLHTYRDGVKILWKIFCLFRDFKPLTFFGALFTIFFISGLLAGTLPVIDYIKTQFVSHVPLAILATGLILLSSGCLFLGILLHVLNWRFKELHSVIMRIENHL